MEKYPKIAIIYLLYYHSESYVDDAVSAIKKIDYPKHRLELVIVNNPHPELGSFARHIDENVMPLSGKELPHVTLINQSENVGFAKGNNSGLRWAMDNDFDYAFFHNNDGFLSSNALEPLVRQMQSDKTIGAAQSLMLLYPDTDYINSSGNTFHYLGFGFCNDYRNDFKSVELSSIKDIDYASGAAMMLRLDLIKELGGLDKDFFMYHEDMELSFRLRSAGYDIKLVSDSIFYHKYRFARSIEKYYWMERNRHAVMLMYFKIPTLLLLLPIGLALEVGLWYFAYKNGYSKQRIQVYKYWLRPAHWKLWLKKRKKIQKMKQVKDRDLLKKAGAVVMFQEKEMNNPILNKIGNPIMKAYHRVVVKGLIQW